MDGVIAQTRLSSIMKNWLILSSLLPNVRLEKKYNEILLAGEKRHIDEHLATIDTVAERRNLIDRFLFHSTSLKNSDEPVFSGNIADTWYYNHSNNSNIVIRFTYVWLMA